MRVLTRRLACAALALPAAAAAAQVPVSSPTPIASYPEPFSQVVGVRELRDGRVIVADARDRTLQVVDFAKGTATPLGREGSGPGEWGLPGRLFALPGDSTLMPDVLNDRFLLIGPSGRGLSQVTPAAARESARPPGPAAGPRIAMGPGIVNLRGVDAQGRLYSEGSPVVVGADGNIRAADSVPVLRRSRDGAVADTVAWIRLPRNGADVRSSGSGSRRNVMVRIGGATPYAARDEWTVLPDGRVVVVRAATYHVEVFGGGAPVRGAPVRYPPVRIGEAEKAEWREQQRGATRMMVTNDNGQVRRQVGSGGGPAPEEPAEWPTVKPPFLGQGAVIASPAGEVWVARAAAANATATTYDVFDGRGTHVRQVTFPARTTVVGFGANAVYAVTRDADDVQALKRYRDR